MEWLLFFIKSHNKTIHLYIRNGKKKHSFQQSHSESQLDCNLSLQTAEIKTRITPASLLSVCRKPPAKLFSLISGYISVSLYVKICMYKRPCTNVFERSNIMASVFSVCCCSKTLHAIIGARASLFLFVLTRCWMTRRRKTNSHVEL